MNVDTTIRHIAMLGSAIWLTFVGIGLVLARSPEIRAQVFPEPHQGYEVGDRLEPAADPSTGSKPALVLFARGSCPACQAAAPFFRSVHEVAKRRFGASLTLVTFDAATAAQYAGALDLAESSVRVIAPAAYQRMKLSAVPTLLVLGSDGRVRLSLIGKPGSQREGGAIAAVMDALAGG